MRKFIGTCEMLGFCHVVIEVFALLTQTVQRKLLVVNPLATYMATYTGQQIRRAKAQYKHDLSEPPGLSY